MDGVDTPQTVMTTRAPAVLKTLHQVTSNTKPKTDNRQKVNYVLAK